MSISEIVKNKLTITLVWFVSCISVLSSVAQVDDYFDKNYINELPKILSEELKEGVFFSSEDFANNNAKKIENLVFYRKGEKSGLFSNFTHELYLKEQKKERYYDTKYWGYCDGNMVYINYRNELSELFVLGKYSLFKHTETSMSPGYMNANGVMSPGTLITTTATYIYDIDENKIDLLSKKKLKELLKPTPQLLKQFNSERGKNKKIIEYIILLNKY